MSKRALILGAALADAPFSYSLFDLSKLSEPKRGSHRGAAPYSYGLSFKNLI
jgi:hypothetical protein